MATKRKRKSRKPVASGMSKRSKPAKRRRPKSKGLLSDGGKMHTLVTNGAKHTISAGLGGLAGAYARRQFPANWGKGARLLAILAVGLGGTYMGFPVMSAGAVGGLTALEFPTGVLNDDGEPSFADADALSDMPLFLDDDGQPMVLEEGDDGRAGYRYLSEEEIAILDEQGAFAEYEEV